MSIYSERMLQISDNVRASDWGGRSAHKRAWMNAGRMEIWKECGSLEEFARRASISIGRARELDQHFAKVLCTEAIQPKVDRRVKGFEWFFT